VAAQLDSQATVEAICTGKLVPAARLITRIEQGDPEVTPLLQQLYLRGGRSHLLGITGPPGAGKSTLVNQLISAYRQHNKRVAVLAVDPTSPFSGGAILGDRVRMNRHATDPNVFIRSMASRGQLGGLAKAAGDAVTVLDAMDFDVVIIETVGVGQSEIDILRHAQCVLLLQTPESGDRIQAVKAGVMEIGDIYVINKADHEGAEAMKRGIEEMLHMSAPLVNEAPLWQAPVLLTQAEVGEGVDELLKLIQEHRDFMVTNPSVSAIRLRQQMRHRILAICHQLTQQQLFSPESNDKLEQTLARITRREHDPYSIAKMLLANGNQAKQESAQ
jgi:LAO/AO transport system kinase